MRDLARPPGSPIGEVREWLFAAARDAGAMGVIARSRVEWAESGRLVADDRFTRVSTTMCLELDPARVDHVVPVELRPMSVSAYLHHAERAEREYAAERHASGEPREDAERIAAEQMAGLLPDGLDTRAAHFFTPVLAVRSWVCCGWPPTVRSPTSTTSSCTSGCAGVASAGR